LPRYKIFLRQEYEETIEVEANSVEEAIEIAESEGIPALCFQCAGYGRKWSRNDRTGYKIHSVLNLDNNVLTVPPGVQTDD